MWTALTIISVLQMPDIHPGQEKSSDEVSKWPRHSSCFRGWCAGCWQVCLAGTEPSVGTQLYNFKPFSHIPLDRLILSEELEKWLTRLMVPSSLAASPMAFLTALASRGEPFCLISWTGWVLSHESHIRQALSESVIALVIILLGYL